MAERRELMAEIYSRDGELDATDIELAACQLEWLVAPGPQVPSSGR
jgi:hypothetical protein